MAEATQEVEEVQDAQTEPTTETGTDTSSVEVSYDKEGGEGEESSTDETLLGKGDKEEATEEKQEVPEKYEFTFPEGMEVDEGLLEKANPLFKELGLSQEQAQKLVDLQIGQIQAQAEQYQKTIEGWKEESVKMLGAESKSQLSLASKFIDKYGTDEVRQVLNDTGLGNHPEVVKMFIKAGKDFGNDSLAEGKSGKTINDPERLARKMFPNTKYD